MRQQNSLPENGELRIYAASCSDRGRVRRQNEDAIALLEPSDQGILAQLGRLYLLADGAGGHAAGEIASSVAVEAIAEVYFQQGADKARPHSDADMEQPRRHIIRAFGAAHQRIRQLAAQRREYRGMVTTCVAAVVKGAYVLVAHIGDSRAYLVHAPPDSSPTLSCLTTDHSMAIALAKAGALSAEQMRNSPSRHMLIRALGEDTKQPESPDITTCRVQAGDALVLCCDGLWSTLPEEQIAQVVSTNAPQAACQELVRLANEAGGEDNISLVIVAFA
jgi:serine/threonine protein phosphatase PrpC